MDNITHTLVGVALAEGAVRIRASREKKKIDPRWARYAWFFSALANNFPDFDFLYASALGGKVGYLLHHRGHTHTFLLALPQALLVLLAVWVVAHHRRAKFSKLDWRWMIGILAVGPFAHIGLDALNSYGVHPFWPWDNRWFYGDTLFIVEPLLWVTLAPALAWSATLGVGRGLFFGIALLGVSLSWLTPFLPRMHATFLTVVAAVVTWVFWKRTPAQRIAYAGAVSLAIVATF